MATRSNPKQAQTIGKPDQQSRAKAKASADRSMDHQHLVDSEAWPRGVNGQPMAKVTMSASELIPTGQYANVSVGPAIITVFIDPDRVLQTDDGETLPYFTEQQRESIGAALNELAAIVEGDVVAVQRNLVLENLQEHVAQNGK